MGNFLEQVGEMYKKGISNPKFKKAIDYMNEYGQVKTNDRVVTKGNVDKEVDVR